MHCALASTRGLAMTQAMEHDERRCTVQTRVWVEEHDWLYGVFKSPQNTAPKFRLPDLLSACVSLAVADDDGHQRLAPFLATRLALRDPHTERRSCDIWRIQFDQLMRAHRAPWNRFPNPMFELDHLTTGCVALAMAEPEGACLMLRQARLNLLARATASDLPVS